MYILCVAGSADPTRNRSRNHSLFVSNSALHTLHLQNSYVPPANHSPSGLYAMLCHATLLIGSVKRYVGSSSTSGSSSSSCTGKCVGRLNCRRTRSEEFVSRRLRGIVEMSYIWRLDLKGYTYRPYFAKPIPRMTPEPDIL